MNKEFDRDPAWNYEQTVEQVESIVEEIESGLLPLEEVFEKFAIAVEHLHECESFLNRGKTQMDLAIETLESEDEIDF
jgi:exodeoxyribonuclease VII small subunit